METPSHSEHQTDSLIIDISFLFDLWNCSSYTTRSADSESEVSKTWTFLQSTRNRSKHPVLTSRYQVYRFRALSMHCLINKEPGLCTFYEDYQDVFNVNRSPKIYSFSATSSPAEESKTAFLWNSSIKT